MDTLHVFTELFGTEKQCLDYLYSLRWPDGYRCPRCYHNEAWQIKERKYKCRKCGYQATVLAGTLFQDIHLPISTWFKAIWYVCSQTGVTSVLDLQKELGLGSYRTAWTMLLKIRKIMADRAPSKLSGRVAVNQYHIHRSNRAKKIDLLIAVELQQDGSFGNICMEVVQGDYCQTHNTLVQNTIRKGARVITDCNPMFLGSVAREYTLSKMPLCQYGKQRLYQPVGAVVKELEDVGLFGTQSLSSSTKQMKSYLDECCYKFNHRNMTTAEMFEEILYSAVRTDPLTYHEIVT